MSADDRLQRAAMRLESLMPRAMAELFRSDDTDPLRGHPVGQVRLVRALMEGERTGAELCESLELSASSLVQMSRRLIRSGLVEKAPALQDRRVRTYRLTEAGTALMKRRREARVGRASSVLGRVPQARVEALIDLLEGILAPKMPAIAVGGPDRAE